MDTIKDHQKYKLVKENNKKVVSEGKQLLKSLKNEKRHLEELKNNSI